VIGPVAKEASPPTETAVSCNQAIRSGKQKHHFEWVGFGRRGNRHEVCDTFQLYKDVLKRITRDKYRTVESQSPQVT
jgi:hypothetical protein